MIPQKPSSALGAKSVMLGAALLVAAAVNVSAQPATGGSAGDLPPVANAAPPSSADQVVQMNAFQVTTTQGHGYVFTNSTEAFKTSASLMTIPQVDVVVTNDALTDLGYENMTDSLQYWGVYGAFESDSVEIRGGGNNTQMYEDEMPVHAGGWTDPNLVDSVEIIKGDAEGLYMLNSGLGGIVMKSMKKPLPYSQNIFWSNVNDIGLWQVGIDSTGPVGKIGDVNVSYRLVADYQRGNAPFTNLVDNRRTIYPYLQLQYHNTTVGLDVEQEDVQGSEAGEEILTPTGQLWTGAGRTVSNQPPNNNQWLTTSVVEANLVQKFSDNWQMHLAGNYYRQVQFGPQVINGGGVDWANPAAPVLFMTNRRNDQRWNYWTAINDLSGKYNLGPSNWSMKNTDIFGWAFTDQVTEKYITSSTTAHFSDASQGIPLLPGQPSSSLAVPDNAAAINAVVVPGLDTYPQMAGGHATTWNGGFYWQHTIDVIPRWLSLTGGWSWISVVTDNVSNILVVPWQPIELHSDQWVHRLAAAFYPLGNQDLMIYALNATNFSPNATVTYLANGTFAPPQQGKDTEVGMKTAFLGGRLSSDFSWFHMETTNIAQLAGIFPNGTTYDALTGLGVEEGVDGDLALTLTPGWQLVGSFYSGHDVGTNGLPVAGTWQDSWGFLTRYHFGRYTPLPGLSVGVGLNRIGGRWVSTSGMIGATAFETPYTQQTGLMKAEDGTMGNAFADYQLNPHILLGVSVENLLNEDWPLYTSTNYLIDPAPPRLYTFKFTYKY